MNPKLTRYLESVHIQNKHDDAEEQQQAGNDQKKTS